MSARTAQVIDLAEQRRLRVAQPAGSAQSLKLPIAPIALMPVWFVPVWVVPVPGSTP